MIDVPGFLRPAEQSERDMAGAAQRRIEASIHRYWLELATGRRRNWWNSLVPADIRTEAMRPRRGGQSTNPEVLVRGLPFDRFVELFEKTFPNELNTILGPSGRRREHHLEVLITARDAAGHVGRPYLAVEARMAASVAWEILNAIPTEHHDPPDLRAWLAAEAMPDHETFVAEPWDICEDSTLTPEFLADTQREVTDFKRRRATGDGGFSEMVERVIGHHGLNLFMRAGELTMGTGLPAFSGLFHENDLGVLGTSQLSVLELKHRKRRGVIKDDLMLFNQKTLDFQLALIRAGTRGSVLRVFVTNDAGIPDRLRAFCLQWGIVLVEPSRMPIPVLVAAMRDLDGTAAAADDEFERQFLRAQRLASLLRPLDRMLVPSTLSSGRRMLDAGEVPEGATLDDLVSAHESLDRYVTSLYSGTGGS